MLKKCEIQADIALQSLYASGTVIKASESLAPPTTGSVCTDSRMAVEGDIFIAIQGTKEDGHRHLNTVASRKLALIISQMPPAPGDTWHLDTPWVLVKNTRLAWSFVAAAAFGNPEQNLKLVGVTGTNGKTSTVWMVGELLRAIGVRCMTIGTLGAFVDKTHIPTSHTTPDPNVLFGLLRAAVDLGANVVAMEASSHALAQSKLAALCFDAVAFTSFSRDHLDFHETVANYWSTKWSLFTNHTKPDASCVYAAGLDSFAELAAIPCQNIVYGSTAKVRQIADRVVGLADNITFDVNSSDFSGSSIEIRNLNNDIQAGRIPYFAEHAVENFVAAWLLSSAIVGKEIGAEYWSQMRPVPGRLEQIIRSGCPVTVVDYAHTPDALEKTLNVLKPLCQGQLWVVFGCGGNRDRGKRPIMGAIASQLADQVVITSDNPRNEDPMSIIAEILAGVVDHKAVHIEVDRERAIQHAVNTAGSLDLILIAGKGHETQQILGDRAISFDDRLIAGLALNNRAKGRT